MPTFATSHASGASGHRLPRAALLLALLGLAGCPDEPPLPPTDLGGPGGDDLGCYVAPVTHLEILNACTGAQSLTKQPVLPLLRPDGTLPPLP
jgi:hypothetical protein